MIEQGQELPAVTLTQLTDDGMQSLTNKELFEGKKVVLFAVPGAFTPTCSNAHLVRGGKGTKGRREGN